MTDPTDRLEVDEYLKEYETVISDRESAVRLINQVIVGHRFHGPRELVWRGLTSAKFWPDHSLYRLLQRRNSQLAGADAGRPPFEADLRKFEAGILDQARSKWRFDHLSALEIFARIRHFGGPTRLLDVTFNPLIALWFAVEKQFDDAGREMPETDGRLFAFDVSKGKIILDPDWSGRELPWDSNYFEKFREVNESEPHWIWKPPSYNDRIPAQNSAFLIGRVPAEVELLWKYFTDKEFVAKLESLPLLISKTESKISSLSEFSKTVPIEQKLRSDFELYKTVVEDFKVFGEFGREIDGLTEASLKIEERETGAKFYRRFLSLAEEITFLEGAILTLTGEGDQTKEVNIEEFVSSSTPEELKDYDDYLLPSFEHASDMLAQFKEEITSITEWIVSVAHPRRNASIAMVMRNADDSSQPNSNSSYTIRILAAAKPEIREILESSYGYSASTLYPDIMELAEKGENQFE